MPRPFTDIIAAISGNPVKNGTTLVHGRSIPDCYNTYSSTSTINILMNGDYTDLEDEAANLVAAIDSFGKSYSTFTDISQSSFSSFSSGTLIIPEIQGEDLDADLSSGAKDTIATFVSDGGTLITFGPNSNNLYILLNNVFGFSLDTNGVSTPINLTSGGLSLFPTAPSTIPDNDGVDSLDTSTLPPDSVTLYEGDGENQSIVTMMPYGSGKIYVMGWDWYDGAPVGEQDGGWLDVLNLILPSVAPCDGQMYYGMTYNRYVQEYPTISGIQSKYGDRFYNGIFVSIVDGDINGGNS